MPRKGLRPREKRGLPSPDYKYDSILVARFINKINHTGKKSIAEKVFQRAMDIIEKKTKKNPLEVFNKCIENVRPLLEVKPRRVGGATYQVPSEVKQIRSTTLAMRWILSAVRSKKGKPISHFLAEEIMAGSNKEGVAFKKREDTHRMADANRAFAHFKI